jgi:hypothetical protein
MKPKVYVETSIVSYVAARPSRDLIVAAHQQITHEWWDVRRAHYDLYVSQIVVREARAGDPSAAARRMQVLQDMPLLDVTAQAALLAEQFILAHCLPQTAAEDALHIALAAIHSLEYLLTWNCTHIANATMRPNIRRYLSRNPFPAIVYRRFMFSEFKDRVSKNGH